MQTQHQYYNAVLVHRDSMVYFTLLNICLFLQGGYGQPGYGQQPYGQPGKILFLVVIVYQ